MAGMSRFTDRLRSRENGHSTRPGVLPPPAEVDVPQLRSREKITPPRQERIV